MTVAPIVGNGCDIAANATVGHAYHSDTEPPVIGDECTIRAGTIVYDDVVIGDRFSTGHNALVRELTDIGDDVLVGTNTVIDGRVEIGSGVSLQTGVYIPTHTTIGDDVFIGPHAVFTNDPVPVRAEVDMDGPTIEDDVSIGANATVLPGVTVGEGSFVAAGAVVTHDVPPHTLAVGVPTSHEELPAKLDGPNLIR
ncbi:acyltransferase [Haloferax denitrificans]|uniref:Transferase hexapeptide repeat containing protein n=1 Tax=Haloferax denitrificans ATCC 35960 TaxID=662478 RepID=M0JGL8_9EURY|nr:acyltransferase [Haloferax denitrificans]EMA08272.1 transferase hexapeptide repeat containing protein [Haloferax denitrificans ATCC 35960]